MLHLAMDLGRASAERAIAERAEREGAGAVAPAESASPPADKPGKAIARSLAPADCASQLARRGTRSMAIKAARPQEAIQAVHVDLHLPVQPSCAGGGGSKPSDASDDGKADEECGAVERDATDFDVIEGNDYDLDGDDTNERDAIGLSGHPDEEEDKNEEKDEEEDFEESQCAS